MPPFKDSGHHWWMQCSSCDMAWFIGSEPEDEDAADECERCSTPDAPPPSLPEDVARDRQDLLDFISGDRERTKGLVPASVLVDRLASAAALVSGLEDKAKAAEAFAQQADASLARTESERDALKVELAASEEASGMYSERSERSGRFAEQADRLERELTEARRLNSGVVSDLDAARQEAADARQTASEERRLREYAEDESAVARAKIAKSERDADAAREQLRDLSGENERLTARVAELEREGAEQYAEAVRINKMHDAAVARVAELEAEAEGLAMEAQHQREARDAAETRALADELTKQARAIHPDAREYMEGYRDGVDSLVARLTSTASWPPAPGLREAVGTIKRQILIINRADNAADAAHSALDALGAPRFSNTDEMPPGSELPLAERIRRTPSTSTALTHTLREAVGDLVEALRGAEDGVSSLYYARETEQGPEVLNAAGVARLLAAADAYDALQAESAPAPAGLLEAVGPLVERARPMLACGSASGAWVLNGVDVARIVAAYDAAKGGEAPMLSCPLLGMCHGSRVHCDVCGDVKLLCNMEGQCDLHRERWTDWVLERSDVARMARDEGREEGRKDAADSLRQSLDRAERLLKQARSQAAQDDAALFKLSQDAEKARKWDAAVERAKDEERLHASWYGLNVKDDVAHRAVAYVLDLDTPPSGPGGGVKTTCAPCLDSECGTHPTSEWSTEPVPGWEPTATSAPLTPESLAAVAREALDAFDATKRPGHPDSVVPLLRARDEALERLRRALAGNVPRVLREERVVEVLAAWRERSKDSGFAGLSVARASGRMDAAKGIARDLGLTLPGGEPAPTMPTPEEVHAMMRPMDPDWTDLGPSYAAGYAEGVHDERARIAPTPQHEGPALNPLEVFTPLPPNEAADFHAVMCPGCANCPPEPAAPEVVWEAHGIQVRSDGDLDTADAYADPPAISRVLARALAEAKRELNDSKVGHLVRAEILATERRKAAEAQRKACAEAVLAGPCGVEETKGEVHARVASVPLVTG